jgi:phage terminase large subunit-like protein
MSKTQSFTKTEKQKAALKIMVDCKYTLLYGGSRSGKTFTACYAILVRALKAPNSRHLICRLRFAHAKQAIWYDTMPKVLALCFPGLAIKTNKQDWFYELPNGAQIWLGGLDEKERVEKILGKEYVTIFISEATQIAYTSYKIILTRLAQKIPTLVSRIYLDCNPTNKRSWIFQMFMLHKDPTTGQSIKRPNLFGCIRMNPEDNRQNIHEGYIEDVLEQLSDRERLRFLLGEFQDEAEGALFKYDHFKDKRVDKFPEGLVGSIGVDPAVTANERSDATGIVTSGMKTIQGEKHLYVGHDDTVKGSPHKWGLRVSKAFYRYPWISRVVGESNQGGDLVMSNIHAIDGTIPVKLVHAYKSKEVRAQAVAAVCEKGHLHLVGELPELEDQMTSWVPESGMPSPNNFDAMIWACRSLLGGGKSAGTW